MEKHRRPIDGCFAFYIYKGNDEMLLVCQECENEQRAVKYQIKIEGSVSQSRRKSRAPVHATEAHMTSAQHPSEDGMHEIQIVEKGRMR